MLDKRIWKPDIKCMFSVKSFFKDLTVNSDRMEGWKSFWNPLLECWLFVGLQSGIVS